MKLRESASITIFNWPNFIWITLVHIIAVSLCWYFFTWQAFFLFIIVHYLVGLVGITFGFHRLLTHKGFKTPKIIANIAAFFGTLACQGGPISWVGQHRVHHAYSDQLGDPHDINKGFWHSHVGFIFMRRQDLNEVSEVLHYCPDIAKSKFFLFLENNMILLQFAVGFILFGLGGVLGKGAGFDTFNAVSFAIWGIFVRLVVGYHVTWFVNSATHKWGSRPNLTTDLSSNNWWVAILAFGEGWHNNHHAQPRAARHGWHWWQLDQTWILITILKFFKLAHHIQLPKIASTGKQSTLLPKDLKMNLPEINILPNQNSKA